MPLLIVYASYGMLHWRTFVSALGGGRWLAPALIVLVYVGFCLPYFHSDAVHLWNHGTYANAFRP